MIVILKKGHTEDDIQKVLSIASELSFQTHLSRGTERTIVGIIGDDSYVSVDRFQNLQCVEEVVKVLKPYKLVTKYFHPDPTIVYDTRKHRIGGGVCCHSRSLCSRGFCDA